MQGMAKTSGRPGRKPRPANQGQRVSLGLKVTPEIKNQLDAEAKRNGRTQSQEAEARLENSFRNERVLDEAIELAFERINGDLLIAVFGGITKAAAAASHILTDNEHWSDDPDTLTAAVFLINSLFDSQKNARGSVSELRVDLAIDFMTSEILRIMNNEEWLSERRRRLGVRAALIESWLKSLQRSAKPLDLEALTKRIGVLDEEEDAK